MRRCEIKIENVIKIDRWRVPAPQSSQGGRSGLIRWIQEPDLIIGSMQAGSGTSSRGLVLPFRGSIDYFGGVSIESVIS
jgi:hypothetical protein